MLFLIRFMLFRHTLSVISVHALCFIPHALYVISSYASLFIIRFMIFFTRFMAISHTLYVISSNALCYFLTRFMLFLIGVISSYALCYLSYALCFFHYMRHFSWLMIPRDVELTINYLFLIKKYCLIDHIDKKHYILLPCFDFIFQ